MKVKTVLLDFDGVMVKNQPWKVIQRESDGFYSFDKSALKHLKQILNETRAMITLITTHKTKYTDEQWEEIFRRRGIQCRIKKAKEFDSRIDEVENWYKTRPTDQFVILDDDKSLNDLRSEIKERFVLIESGIGLTKEKTELAIKILNEK